MRHGWRNLIVLVCITLIAVAIALGLIRYLQFGPREAGLYGVVSFGLLLVLHNHISLLRHFNRVEKYNRSAHQFERTIAERLASLETRQSIDPQTATLNEVNVAVGGNNSNLPNEGDNSNSPGILNTLDEGRGRQAQSANVAEQNHDNIIPLNGRMERKGTSNANVGSSPIKIKPSQLSKALEKGGTELFLQPVLELPSRNIRFFEAFVRVRIGDNILTAKQFLPAAKDSGQIARIDLLSLGLTFKVVRGLQRQNSDYPVFWNIAPQTLGNKGVFKELLEQLRANQPLNRQLICEISYGAYVKLNTVQSDNLARIRDLGYELSLDKGNSSVTNNLGIENIIKNGMFATIKIPAPELMRITKNDIATFASHIVPIAANNKVTLIASDVENDAQAVSMIDADIFLAQGDGLMQAKALKNELGNA